MKISLNTSTVKNVFEELKLANNRFSDAHPGDPSNRQPVHTVYGGAHIFHSQTAAKMGASALKHLQIYTPDFATFAKALGLNGHDSLPETHNDITALKDQLSSEPEKIKTDHPIAFHAITLYERVIEKLKKEPVEDFRIDFEDGYGNRPDDEEDAHACSTAEEVAKGYINDSLPPFIGIRIKPFTEELKERSVRTLDLFISTLLNKNNSKLPENFVVTLPKVTIPEQVAALVKIFEELEAKNGLMNGELKLEIMVETPQSILDQNGNSALPHLVRTGQGRCTGAHFGVYDYTASNNITPAYQAMDHPVCDFARHMMQVALADSGVALSDGATNILPVGPHKSTNKEPLSNDQLEENKQHVFNAWKVNYNNILHSLKHGYYQGWDLHPSQLPIRYAAVYSFFIEGFDLASKRLKSFMEKAAQATLLGDVFDDAATGQALLNYFLRGISCGAFTAEDTIVTGLTVDEIRTRSFNKILKGRLK